MSVEAPAEIGKVGHKSPPLHSRFGPGNKANPGGKPVKSRNRLQGDFLRTLADDFEKYGKKAIVAAREDDPLGYVKVCASLMPKEVELTRPLDDIPDEQLDAAVIAVRAIFAAQDTGNRADAPRLAQPAEVIPSLSEAG